MEALPRPLPPPDVAEPAGANAPAPLATLPTVDAACLADLAPEHRPVFLARVETPGADGVLVERFAVRFPPGAPLPEAIDAAARFEVRNHGTLLEKGIAGVGVALMALIGAVIYTADGIELGPGWVAALGAAAALLVAAARTPRARGFAPSDSGDVVFLETVPDGAVRAQPRVFGEWLWGKIGRVPLSVPAGIALLVGWSAGTVGDAVGLLAAGAVAWGAVRLLAGPDDEEEETGARRWLRRLGDGLGIAIPAGVTVVFFHLLGQGLPSWLLGVAAVVFLLDRWHVHVREEPDDAALQRQAERLLMAPILTAPQRVGFAVMGAVTLFIARSMADPLLDGVRYAAVLLMFLAGAVLLLLGVTGGPRGRASHDPDPDSDLDPEAGDDARDAPAAPAALAPPPLDLTDVLSREREADPAFAARDR